MHFSYEFFAANWAKLWYKPIIILHSPALWQQAFLLQVSLCLASLCPPKTCS